MLKFIKPSVCLLVCMFFFSSALLSRTALETKQPNSTFSTANDPLFCTVDHRIGKIVLAISNDGRFGVFGGAPQDCFTGEAIQACEYPKSSKTQYLYAGAFWIGAVVGRDTLVSEGADGWSRQGYEFVPPTSELYALKKRTILYPDIDSLFEDAISEEDYIAIYQDTSVTYAENDASGRPHRPLNIEVNQSSYAWSYPYAEDFVLFDYKIKNIGSQTLNYTYMGLYVDGDVGYTAGTNTNFHTDDICGFIESVPTKFLACDFVDTVNIAWIADNDGDPTGSIFNNESVPNVTATRIVRTPQDSLDVSFNWWVSNGNPNLDYGPRERSGVGRLKEDFRDLGTGGLGTPEGDANKYYFMRNKEFDFDQIYSKSIGSNDSLWLPPHNADLAGDIADGYDTRYLLSFGPFTIKPGEVLPVSFAYIGGMNLHHIASNGDNLPDNPDLFDFNLDFSDLGENAAWASRVYDNPGIDSDGNGNRGKFRVCCLDSSISSIDTTFDSSTVPPTIVVIDSIWEYNVCDTLYYQGDGIPDFQGASPPPAPTFWLKPELNKIKVRFNGLRSETTMDVFSRIIDFEGYRVYLGRDDRETSFSLFTSYDIEDYNKYVWNDYKVPEPGFELLDIPFTLTQLKSLYGADFNPLLYTRNSPYNMPGFPDSTFYFVKQDFNQSELGVSSKINKTYPNEPYPSNLNPDSADASELTDDGYLKYFEYNVEIDNLLPTVPWYVNVTAFDFGSPISGLPALETAKGNGTKNAYPLYSQDQVDSSDLPIYVYPNPYRIDGNYNNDGFERSSSSQSNPDRIRRVHFVNIPPKCTIRIYTLDGDLVREIDHDLDPTDPNAKNATWDLITRNTQLAVTGLYYWSVESSTGETEIGKLVLVM